MNSKANRREIVRRAVSLYVLEPEDVSGRDASNAMAFVDKLVEDGLISENVFEALARLVDLRPSDVDSSISPDAGGGTAMPIRDGDLNVDSQTSLPFHEGGGLNVGTQTVMPAREGGGGKGGGLNVGTQTAMPAREDSGGGKGGGLNVGTQTVMPAREDSGGGKGGGLNVGTQTVMPAREGGGGGGGKGGGLNVGTQTVMPAREGGGGKGGGLNLGTQTVMPLRDSIPELNLKHQAADGELRISSATSDGSLNVSRGTQGGTGSGTVVGGADPEEALLDLSVLETEEKEAIEAAAFLRVSITLGFTTREQAGGFGPGKGRIEDRLVEEGLIDNAQAMEVFGKLQTRRFACPKCFGVMDAGIAVCPTCGRQRIQMPTGAGGGTIIGREAAKGIEGFPGVGGTFAGYEILEHVAEGGMGVVFKARQTQLNRLVALKVMRGGSMASKSRRRRFLQEAEAAAALKHPSIVGIHEIDEVSGYPFYTMDFIEGVTLNEYVKQKHLNFREVAHIMRMVGDAVNHFHLHGIVHRDLKPDNILVGEDGVPKIIDFGIAKKLGQEAEAGQTRSKTLEGDVLGTPHYMSPEQAAGRVSEVDIRTDVYALGAIVYELVTGNPPFYGLPQARLVVAIQDDDPPLMQSVVKDVEPDLDWIVMKAMSKERERRYQTAADLSADLDRFLQYLPIMARPMTIRYRIQKVVRRRFPYVVAGSIVTVILSAVGVVALAQRASRMRTESEKVAQAVEATDKNELDKADKLITEVLTLNDSNPFALSQRNIVDAKRKEKDRIERETREAHEREQQAKIDKANADAALERAKTADRLRVAAEAAAKAQAEARARELLGQSKAAKDDLNAIPPLNEALGVLPQGESALRTEIEGRKIEVSLLLAQAAVDDKQSKSAEYWVTEAGRLRSAKDFAKQIGSLEQEIAKLKSGVLEFAAAQKLYDENNYIPARDKLRALRDAGVMKDDVAKLLKQVMERLSEGVTTLRNQALSELKANPRVAKATATKGRALDPDSDDLKALVVKCDEEIASRAIHEAQIAWGQGTEGKLTAVANLRDAFNTVDAPGPKTRVKADLDARNNAIENSNSGLKYIGAITELDLSPFQIMDREVTNKEYKEFVDAKGYSMDGIWDPSAVKVLASFIDLTKRPGPRNWKDGTYGDPTRADLPVTGVTYWEARAFARWRRNTTKKAWTLPSAAQWEAAAGWDPIKGRMNEYPWGSEWNEKNLVIETEQPRPFDPSRADKSPFDVYDMAGNAAEWVETGKGPGLKGSSFDDDPTPAQYRSQIKQTKTPPADPPAELIARTGFRLVVE